MKNIRSSNAQRKKFYEVAANGKYLSRYEMCLFLHVTFALFNIDFFLGDKDSLMQLIQNGVNIDEEDSAGNSALIFAAKQSE